MQVYIDIQETRKDILDIKIRITTIESKEYVMRSEMLVYVQSEIDKIYKKTYK